MGTLLITGGGGFVLSHLARQWVEWDTHNRVVILDIALPDDPIESFLDHSHIDWIEGNVANRDVWERVPDPEDICYIVHGAAVTSINRHVATDGVRGAIPALTVNMLGVAEALGFAETCPKLERFINVSSGSVYPDSGGDELQKEEIVLDPEGWYPISKFTGEGLTREAQTMGLPAISVRLSGVYGPLDRPTTSRAVDCVPKQLCHAARAGESVGVFGLAGGGDWIHAADVAGAMIALLLADHLHWQAYNIAQGTFTPLSELLDYVPELQWQETSLQEADIICNPAQNSGRYGAYDISRIKADAGWRPRPIADAIRDYCAWLAEHHE